VTRVKKIAIVALAISGFLFFLAVPARVGSIDSLCLTARGDDMAPAICDGDTVEVKICTDGELIRVGAVNSTSPGDIIVYCAAAIVASPASMWACGRAVSKRFEDGYWYIKTQLDSSSEPDPWSVPEYYLLGVVVGVTHSGSGQSEQVSDQSSGGEPPNLLTFSFDLAVGVGFGLVLGFAARFALKHDERSRWINLQRSL
jgi:hypothetical protein